MSQSGSRGRGMMRRRLFEAELGPSAYSADNLVEFIRQAGRQYVDELNARLERERRALRDQGIAFSSPQYRQALQQVRFDYITELQEENPDLIRRLPEQPTATTAKLITSEEMTNLFNNPTGGRTAVLNLIENNPAEAFNLNALRDAARLLGVKGVSAAMKGLKGDQAKAAIRDLILGRKATIRELEQVEQQQKQAYAGRYTVEQLNSMSDDELRRILAELGLDRTGTRQALVRRILASQPAPSVNVQYTRSSLEAMKVDQLRNILRNNKLKVSGTKPELVNRILESQQRGTQGPTVNIDEIIAQIRDNIEREGAIPSREMARQISPDVYEQATVTALRELTRLLHLDVPKAGPTATKAELIRALTGRASTAQSSLERTRAIQANLTLCEQSSDEELQVAARELGINTRGLTKIQICQQIYENYLFRFSSLLIEQLGEGGKNTLASLINMPEQQRRTAIEGLARNARYARVSTLPELMREFLLAHYRARALRFAPDSLDIVDAYITTGQVPTAMRDLDDLARVFNDINPELFTLEDTRALQLALDELYNSFIAPVMSGQQGSSQLLVQRFAEFNYSPARRNMGTLSRNRAPMVQAPIQQAPAIEEPIEEEEELEGEDIDEDIPY